MSSISYHILRDGEINTWGEDGKTGEWEKGVGVEGRSNAQRIGSLSSLYWEGNVNLKENSENNEEDL